MWIHQSLVLWLIDGYDGNGDSVSMSFPGRTFLFHHNSFICTASRKLIRNESTDSPIILFHFPPSHSKFLLRIIFMMCETGGKCKKNRERWVRTASYLTFLYDQPFPQDNNKIHKIIMAGHVKGMWMWTLLHTVSIFFSFPEAILIPWTFMNGL